MHGREEPNPIAQKLMAVHNAENETDELYVADPTAAPPRTVPMNLAYRGFAFENPCAVRAENPHITITAVILWCRIARVCWRIHSVFNMLSAIEPR